MAAQTDADLAILCRNFAAALEQIAAGGDADAKRRAHRLALVYIRAAEIFEGVLPPSPPVPPDPGPADTTAPTAPGTPTATVATGTVTLAWTAATDAVGVSYYNVHRSVSSGFTPGPGTLIAQPSAAAYTDPGLAAGTYYYKVTASDAAGNTGPASGQRSATISTADTTAPTVALTTIVSPTVVPQMIYDKNSDGRYEIYRRNMQTLAITRLTNNATYDSWWARPSPDGTKMLFMRSPVGVGSTDYAQTSLWTANIDGSSPTQILANGAHGWTIMGHPDWHPDGTKIVVFGGTVSGTTFHGINVIDLSGNIITANVVDGLDCIWNADGTKIIYIKATDAQNVWSCNPDGTGATKLTSLPAGTLGWDPSVSPDGTKIAFATSTPNVFIWDIWTVNSDGTQAQKVFGEDNVNSSPQWVTNSRLWIFRNAGFRNGFQIESINSDGTGSAWVSDAGQTGNEEWPFPLTPGTVAGAVTLSAVARDDVGVVGVQFKAAGANIGAEVTSPPYSTQWASGSVPNGSCALTAVARDAAGHSTTSAARTVTVANGGVLAPVAAWDFSEGAGTTVADVSGNGHPASIANAVWTTAGKTGACLIYNGTNSLLTVPDTPTLRPTTGMTLEAWIKPSALSAGSVAIAKSAAGVGWSLCGSVGGSNVPAAYITSGGVLYSALGPSSLPLDTWTHIAGTYDGTNLKLLINGVVVTTTPHTGTLDTSTAPITIGADDQGGTVTGLLDEVRLYNVALTAAQVTTDMGTIPEPPPPPPTPPPGSRSVFTWPGAWDSPWNVPVATAAVYAAAGRWGAGANINCEMWSTNIGHIGDGTQPSGGTDMEYDMYNAAETDVTEHWTDQSLHFNPRLSCINTGGMAAAGVPVLMGTIRRWELDQQLIPHVLAVFALQADMSNNIQWPAVSIDSNTQGHHADGFVYGSLWAIRPSVNIASLNLSAGGLIIARALQDYGCLVIDQGSYNAGFRAAGECSGHARLGEMQSAIGGLMPLLAEVTNSAQATPGGAPLGAVGGTYGNGRRAAFAASTFT